MFFSLKYLAILGINDKTKDENEGEKRMETTRNRNTLNFQTKNGLSNSS